MDIKFTEDAYDKMMAYTLSTNNEIGGLGKTELYDDYVLVTEVIILEQEVTKTTTKITDKGMSDFYNFLIDNEQSPSDWKLWWHSHNTMEPFFSQTDIDMIEDSDSEMDAHNWMVSVVTNHREQFAAQIDIFKPVRCTISHCPVKVERRANPYLEEVKEEVTEKVYEKVVVNKFNYNRGYAGYGNGGLGIKSGKKKEWSEDSWQHERVPYEWELTEEDEQAIRAYEKELLGKTSKNRS